MRDITPYTLEAIQEPVYKQASSKQSVIIGKEIELLDGGWDSFYPYGSGKNYVENWDFTDSDVSQWFDYYSKNEIKDNILRMTYKREESGGTKYVSVNTEIPSGNSIILRMKYRTNCEHRVRVWGGVKPLPQDFLEDDGEWHVHEFETETIADKQVFRFYNIHAGVDNKWLEVDWIQITPVDDQHLVVEKTPLENGLTRIQTWGGNNVTKLTFVLQYPVGTTTNTSMYIENKSDEFIIFRWVGSQSTQSVKRDTKNFYSFSQTSKELGSNILIRTLKKSDNLDFIASDPSIVTYEGSGEILSREIKQSELNLEGMLHKSNMRQLKLELIGKHDLHNQYLTFKREFKTLEDEHHIINYGSFRVLEQSYNDDTKTTELIAYDDMSKAHTEFKKEDFNLTFPRTIGEVFKRVAKVIDLETDVTTFPLSDQIIEEDKWSATEYTYRDVLDHIAEVTACTIGIRNNKLDIWESTDTGVVIDYKRSKSMKIGEQVGKFNILNLTREPQHDNYAYPQDWTGIPIDDRKEYVLTNNQIVDKRREHYAPLLYNRIKDIEYHTFNAETFGWGIFDVGDIVTVRDLDGVEYKSIITSELNSMKGFWITELVSEKLDTAKDKYVMSSDQRRQGQSTYLLVDQQNGVIEGVVTELNETTNKVSQLRIDVDSITTKVENMNENNNVIPNLNGNLESFQFWTFANTNVKPFISKEPYRQFLNYSSNFEIKTMDFTLSQFGLSFYSQGKAKTGLGYVVPDAPYSFRGKRVNGSQVFSINVIEYGTDKKLIKTSKFDFNTPSLYESFTLDLSDTTQWVALEFIIPNTVKLNNRLELADMIFNRGNPKDWQESSGDVKLYAQSEIKQLDNQITSTVEEIKIVDGKTEQNKSSINQLSDNIELKVDKDGIISSINLSPEEAKIIAQHISLEGIVTANEYFKILLDGSATMNNAYVNGEIVSTKGKIGGYTITENSLIGNDVTLGNRQIKIGPAILERATVGNEEALAIRSYYLELGDKSKEANWITVGGRKFVQGFTNGGYGVFARNIMPDESTTFSKEIGSSSNRWDNVYLKNQPNVSSDLRYKRLVSRINDDLLDVVKEIKPKTYYTIYDDKIHFGYIAQDVERALYKYALKTYDRQEALEVLDDFAMLSKDESYMSLLYGEIQVLKDAYYQRELDRQDEINKDLQEQINELKGVLNGI